jgi:photosystem II stability/assembly factor-like uncharacterized protein
MMVPSVRVSLRAPGRALAVALFLALPALPASAIQWRSMGPSGGGNLMVARFHPQDPRIIFLGGDVSGIHRTTDGGETWRQVNAGLADSRETAAAYGVMALEISPSNPQILYAGAWRGLFRSTDGGEHWERLLPGGVGVDDLPIGAVAMDPATPQRVIIGEGDFWEPEDGAGRIRRPTDGGATWELIEGTGIDRRANISDLVIDPTSPLDRRTVFASSDRGVYRSTDGGGAWTPILEQPCVTDLAIQPQDPDVLYALSSQDWILNPNQQCGVHRSTDGGNTWTLENQGLGNLFLLRITVDPHHPERLYLGTHGCGFYQGIDLDLAPPTPTPIPQDPHVELHLNATFFHPDDHFLLELTTTNPGPAITVHRYVILDVYGQYWFHPSWGQDPDHESPDLGPDSQTTQTILDFTWPQTTSAAEEIRFWAGLLDPATSRLLGPVDMVSFGYGP